MAFIESSSNKPSGKIDAEIAFARMVRKRDYPKGKIAIANLEKYFENELETKYKTAPAWWKKEYAKEIFRKINHMKANQKRR
jgi:hypothetical protein